MPEDKFTFEISLSVLDHLGRNLYRSFATVLGEAISNSWDADAKNVWIYVDRDKNSFFIKDDGSGMTALDFQNKFLKIGYSKRREGHTASSSGRPYIGRKGIGKLALLSCADKVHVISKKEGTDYIGGVIDNSGLDRAITDDLTPGQYQLGEPNLPIFESYAGGHEKGTIIYFENIKDGIRSSLDFLKKIIALYFRFSLLDDSFNVFIDDEKITLDDLNDLAEKTEFLWRINDLDDPYINDKLTKLKEPVKNIEMSANVKGFIASVSKPRDLKVIGTDERVSVDLFVNGRLRERDILKHIPTARLAENYFYGQIHFNELDDGRDRFTTSREGIVAEDPKYKEFLEDLRRKISEILEDWDEWRIKNRKEGDVESERISKKERASIGLYNAVSGEYEPPKDSVNRRKVDRWVDELRDDAAFNFESYAECFVSENLVRKYIRDKNLAVSAAAQTEISEKKRRETLSKQDGNVNIDIRKNNDDLSYLDMSYLARQADVTGVRNTLHNDSKEYKPIRDAIAHTALLTDEAKRRLTSVYENIKARVKTLLSGNA
ncbi:MAG: DNA mismatch repair protein [Candidatus Abyssobacteria bacterium SURF_5]|uniref:DNA mismatch repair protein n=1 Tax=Abyssobacteria bacterium (strain SURF_5) TaxID=2093360 RepID=A0A3A4N5G1_ABYX5|nr:MAG: DNA mismatch repair protein [Candidatus Abyssubacteria bacterium SURF_5]